MKYTKNANRIPPLELCDDDGNVIYCVHVMKDYPAMYNRLRDALGRVVNAQKEQDTTRIGECVVKLIEGVYGREGADQILHYFRDDYTDLVMCVYQHIYEDVKPALEQIVTERRKMYRRRR